MALSPLPAESQKRAAVRTMFDRIAPRYDLLNRLLTGGLDQRWRRVALHTISVGMDSPLLRQIASENRGRYVRR